MAEVAPVPLSDAGEARYQMLVAEIALIRRDLSTAAEAYFEAGRLTGDVEALRRAAGLAYGTRDFELAERVTSIWTQIAPSDALAHRYRLSVALQSGDIAEAGRRYIAVREDEAVTDQELLDWLRQTPEPDATLAMLTDLGARRPDDATLLLQAFQLAETWRQDEALLDASARLEQMGLADERVLIARSRALERTAGQAVALEDLEASILSGGDELSMEMLKRRGELRFATDDLQGAAGDLDAVLAAAPADPMVLYLVGEIALMQGRLDDAEEHLDRLQSLPGMRDLGSFMLGRLARERGETEAAIRSLDSVTSQDLFLRAQMLAMYIEVEVGEVEAAQQRADALIIRSPEDAASIQSDLAAVLADTGHIEIAGEIYARLLEDSPDDLQFRYGMALVMAQAGEADAAITALEALLEERPDSPDYMNALGYTMADAGRDLPRARELVSRALEAAPDSPSILDSMGWVEFRMGNLEAARVWLERAWDLDQDAEIAAHLGEVLWTIGEHDAARAIWEQAAAEDPDHAVLMDTRMRLEPIAPAPGAASVD
jgi:tetratricopeptide (TPR) repeat protein